VLEVFIFDQNTTSMGMDNDVDLLWSFWFRYFSINWRFLHKLTYTVCRQLHKCTFKAELMKKSQIHMIHILV